MKNLLIILFTGFLLLFGGLSFLTWAKDSINPKASFSDYVDHKGNIKLPKDFRKDMAHLGSWFVPEGGESGFHDVYADAETVDVFRQTGKFRDGAVIVKELRAATAADYTTGQNVSFANDQLKHWFVMIKDTQNRFSDNPNWGEGWGWGLFKKNNYRVNASTDYKKDCLGCHIPARDKDWIYTEAYPTLFK